MQLVPFNPSWADSGSKLDLRGIYQRGELLAPLPIRRHNDHERKGFRYITLASVSDVNETIGYIKSCGINLGLLQESYDRNAAGMFKMADYAAEQPQRDVAEAVQLKSRLAQLEKPTKAVK